MKAKTRTKYITRPPGRLNRKPRLYTTNLANLLKPMVRLRLFNWLAKDGLTYKEAGARLNKQFGLDVKLFQLHTFWQSYCTPLMLKSQEVKDRNPVVLEIRIEISSPNPVNVTARKNPL